MPTTGTTPKTLSLVCNLRDAEGKATEQVVTVKTWFGLQNMRDLTVADIHTYYVVVGGTPVLVHNRNDDGNTTRLGVTRTNPQDWRNQMRIWDNDQVYKGILSRGNRWRIENDLAPRVDRRWVGFFPGDAKLIGEILQCIILAGIS